jgi:hypothetical protein
VSRRLETCTETGADVFRPKPWTCTPAPRPKLVRAGYRLLSDKVSTPRSACGRTWNVYAENGDAINPTNATPVHFRDPASSGPATPVRPPPRAAFETPVHRRTHPLDAGRPACGTAVRLFFPELLDEPRRSRATPPRDACTMSSDRRVPSAATRTSPWGHVRGASMAPTRSRAASCGRYEAAL